MRTRSLLGAFLFLFTLAALAAAPAPLEVTYYYLPT